MTNPEDATDSGKAVAMANAENDEDSELASLAKVDGAAAPKAIVVEHEPTPTRRKSERKISPKGSREPSPREEEGVKSRPIRRRQPKTFENFVKPEKATTSKKSEKLVRTTQPPDDTSDEKDVTMADAENEEDAELASLEKVYVAATTETASANEPGSSTRRKSGRKISPKVSREPSPREEEGVKSRPARRRQPKTFENFVNSEKALTITSKSKKSEKTVNLGKLAQILVSLDESGREEDVVRDGENLSSALVWPMSFPWMHREVASIKNIPRDIDEMPGIIWCDPQDTSPFGKGEFGYGNFEVGKVPRTSEHKPRDLRAPFRSGTRRADDMGVIELTKIQYSDVNGGSTGTTSRESSARSTPLASSSAGRFVTGKRGSGYLQESSQFNGKGGALVDPETEHDIPVHKKQRVGNKEVTTTKRLISVRFAGVSSRMSIFSKQSASVGIGQHVPLMVNAFLPAEVVNGRHVQISSAVRHSKGLGTYDCRYGSSDIPESDYRDKRNKEKRVYAGRVRLLWSAVEAPIGNGRRTFTSMLSHSRCDVGSIKRPRNVRLAIRLNGQLLQTRPRIHGPKAPILPEDDTEVPVFMLAGYSANAINTAISEAAKTIPVALTKPPPSLTGSVGERMCLLNTDQLTPLVLQPRHDDNASTNSDDGTASSDNQSSVIVRESRLDCVPLTDGRIRVACTEPGEMGSCWIPPIVDEAARVKKVCSICDQGMNIEQCQNCGVPVHVTCCWERGRRMPRSVTDSSLCWKCPSCSVIEESKPAPVKEEGKRASRRQIKAPMRFREQEEETSKESAAVVAAAATDSKEEAAKKAAAEKPKDPLQPPKNVLSCLLCPHKGGAMSRAPDGGGWIHEVCRIWSTNSPSATTVRRPVSTTPNVVGEELCSICGFTGPTSACAAEGCSVKFHPMCAKLFSTSARNRIPTEARGSSRNLKSLKERDQFLCTQFTMTMLEVNDTTFNNGSETSSFSDGGTSDGRLVPVVFCGYHNPNRDPFFYSCYPSGRKIGEAMHIPSFISV